MFLMPAPDQGYGLRCHDLAVDFGTGNVVVWERKRGIILQEPSLVAFSSRVGRNGEVRDILAVGHAAKAMLGKTPQGVSVVQPMSCGVIADLESAEALLQRLLRPVVRKGLLNRRRLVVGIPPDVTDVERKAFVTAARDLGAARVHSLPAPLAAAMGAGLVVETPRANMILDLGSGCCEAAVLSLGGIVLCRTLRSGGQDVDAALQHLLKTEYHLYAGLEGCEVLRRELGSLDPARDDEVGEIKGRDTASGLPRTMQLTAGALRPLLTGFARSVSGLAREVLERCPPELAADLVDQGLTLCGGLAQQHGLADFLHRDLRLEMHVDAAPLTTVARGLGLALERRSESLCAA